MPELYHFLENHMKRLAFIIATSFAALSGARAADLPSVQRAPSFTPPSTFLFEGFYVGAQIGALGFADRSNIILAPTNGVLARGTSHGGSFVGGAHAGYDWHIDSLVFGLRADVSGAHAVNAGILPFGIGVRNAVDVNGSLRGRVGYAFDRLLVYASGGLNVAHVEHEYRSPFAFVRKDHIVAAPMVGVGAEYAFDDHWRGNVEFSVSDLRTGKEVSNPFNPALQTRHDAATGAVTLGVSYRFGK